MEQEFDNEIDAILRQTGAQSGAAGGKIAEPHPDADGIAAYAENALPDAARSQLTVHFADCDRCRKILSNLIVVNAEAAPADSALAAPAIIGEVIPWHRKLFLAPNLAFVLGGLVIIFAGFIGYIILQGPESGNMAVSNKQEGESDVAAAPMSSAEELPRFANTAANSANAAVNAPTNSSRTFDADRAPVKLSAANIAPAESTVRPEVPALKPARNETNKQLDGVSIDSTEGKKALADEKKPELANITQKDAVILKRDAESRELARSDAAAPSPAAKTDAGLFARQPAADSSDTKGRTNQRAENDAEDSNVRKIGDKTFELRDGIWYDLAYSGQKTTDIRRGTDSYRKLDSGLRLIANELKGSIIVLWNERAFRIR